MPGSVQRLTIQPTINKPNNNRIQLNSFIDVNRIIGLLQKIIVVNVFVVAYESISSSVGNNCMETSTAKPNTTKECIGGGADVNGFLS